MAFFKFRKGGDEQSATPAQPESVETMRRRAKHRLIGAAVLVLVGVIGFPLLFDKQPRPIAVDMPIEIPDKNKVKPLEHCGFCGQRHVTHRSASAGQDPRCTRQKSQWRHSPLNSLKNLHEKWQLRQRKQCAGSS
jgi:hypothetical protein